MLERIFHIKTKDPIDYLGLPSPILPACFLRGDAKVIAAAVCIAFGSRAVCNIFFKCRQRRADAKFSRKILEIGHVLCAYRSIGATSVDYLIFAGRLNWAILGPLSGLLSVTALIFQLLGSCFHFVVALSTQLPFC